MAVIHSPAPVPALHDIGQLQRAARGCEACPLYARATQTVFGAGDPHAPLMLVGEQPGDSEDRQGLPFVGPAGRVLRQGLQSAGIDPEQTYVTNAVKHFKWVAKGKLRIHAKPNSMEITACRPWLEAEIETVRPRLLLCMGATAAQTLLGPEFRVTKERGQILPYRAATVIAATVHPSSILRSPDAAARKAAMAGFIDDLKVVNRHLQSEA